MTAPIVIFAGLATFGYVGGLQNFNRRLISNLDHLCEIGDIHSGYVALMDDDPTQLPTSISRISIDAFGRNRVGFLASVLRACRSGQELVLGHINLLPVALLAKLLRPSLRTTLFVHGDDVWNDELRPKRFYESWLLKFVDQIAAVSSYTANIMIREYRVSHDKFSIFPNAINEVRGLSDVEAPHGSVICVTRIGLGDRRKHVDRLIAAIAELRHRGRPATLTIIGDGPLRPGLEKLASSLNLSNKIRFLGRISDADLSEQYRSHSIFALPSSKEGFGIVYLEAWSYGLPVICGTGGAPKEIISDGIDGLICNEDDIQDIADKIEMIMEKPEFGKDMGARGREKVLERYLNDNAIVNLRRLLATAPK